MCRRLLTCSLLLACLLPLSVTTAGDKRAPVPDQAALQKATALIEELYGTDLKQAHKDPLVRGRLAATFLQEARDTQDQPAGRYVLLAQAAQLAATGGDIGTALLALDELGTYFAEPKADLFVAKINLLAVASKGTLSPLAYQATVDAALLLLDDALALDDYTAAGKLLAAAETAAVKLKSVPLVASLRKRSAEVARHQDVYDKVKPFLDRLAKNANDAEANLEAGKYYAFVRDDWDKGLPLLAKGSDPALKKLAKDDLAGPKDAAAMIFVGQVWGSLATKLEQHRIPLYLRAYHWLLQADSRAAAGQRKELHGLIRDVMAHLPPEYRLGEIAVELRSFNGGGGPVFSAAISPDGRKIVSGSQDGVVRLWDVKTGREVRRLEGHTGPVWTVAFSPDGRTVASGSFDNSIRLWDVSTGRAVKQLEGHTDYVRSLAFSNDSYYLLSTGDDRTVRLWDVTKSEPLRTLEGHGHFVFGACLVPAEPWAASASLDRTVRIWDLPDGKEVKKLEGHTDTVLAVAATPDGQRLLSASTDKTLRQWDVNSGETVRILKGHEGYVNGVAITPDGRRALSASADRTLRLWDLTTGSEVRKLDGHLDTIWTVRFSRDGRYAVSASHDGTVRLWGPSR